MVRVFANSRPSVPPTVPCLRRRQEGDACALQLLHFGVRGLASRAWLGLAAAGAMQGGHGAFLLEETGPVQSEKDQMCKAQR